MTVGSEREWIFWVSSKIRYEPLIKSEAHFCVLSTKMTHNRICKNRQAVICYNIHIIQQKLAVKLWIKGYGAFLMWQI